MGTGINVDGTSATWVADAGVVVVDGGEGRAWGDGAPGAFAGGPFAQADLAGSCDDMSGTQTFRVKIVLRLR